MTCTSTYQYGNEMLTCWRTDRHDRHVGDAKRKPMWRGDGDKQLVGWQNRTTDDR